MSCKFDSVATSQKGAQAAEGSNFIDGYGLGEQKEGSPCHRLQGVE